MEKTIKSLLGKDISKFVLLGKGAVNLAYMIETVDDHKYIVKQERTDKEFQPQNNLVVEAHVVEHLSTLHLTLPIPHVAFISEDPQMYAYEYIDGSTMKDAWPTLMEDQRISICRNIGAFHAEISMAFTKETADSIGITIDMSTCLHPEVLADYERLTLDATVPDDFKNVARKAMGVFDSTPVTPIFQFIHNDAHHENIIIKDGAITGVIDFGNAEYGEITKEFSRYIRDYPDYFEYIVSAYEEKSGNALSRPRLVSNAIVNDFVDIVESYRMGGDCQVKALAAVAVYRELLV